MRPAVQARWTFAPLLVPLVVAAFLARVLSEEGSAGGYPLARTSLGLVTVSFVAPLLGGWSAWLSGRLRGLPQIRVGARGRLVGVVFPLSLGTGLLVSTFIALVVAFVGLDPSPEGLMWTGATTMTLLSGILLGAALGQAVPRVFAAPIAMGVLFVWLAFAAASDVGWLRHASIGSVLATCCIDDQQPAASTWVACMLVATVWAIGAAAVLRSPWHGPRAATAVLAVFAGGIALGAVPVRDADPFAQAARTTVPVCAAVQETTACVWPEQRQRLNSTVEEIASLRRRLDGSGLPFPTTWTQSPLTPAGGAELLVGDGQTAEDRLMVVAWGLASTWTCRPRSADVTPDERVLAWAALRLGMDADVLRKRMSPDAVSAAVLVVGRTPMGQAGWVRSLGPAGCRGAFA